MARGNSEVYSFRLKDHLQVLKSQFQEQQLKIPAGGL